MKSSHSIFFFIIILMSVSINLSVNGDFHRRSLHQPIDPQIFTLPPPPPLPSTPTPSSITQPTPASTKQLSKPIKTVAIAGSITVVILGMLSALAFFLYRQQKKFSSKSQMPVEEEYSLGSLNDSGILRSSFLSIGTMEMGPNGDDPPLLYRRLNSLKKMDSYLPNPELQPLPPLSQHQIEKSISETSVSDEESKETVFLTPEWTPISPPLSPPLPSISPL